MVSPRLILNCKPLIPKSCFVHPSAVIAGNVKLGEKVICFIWLPFHRGDRSNVQDGAVIHARGVFGNNTSKKSGLPTIIGADVSLGHKACVHGCVIEDKVLIGINAVVLDGVLIKPYTLVAAGAVVTPGKVLDGGLWAGTPARKIRDLTDDERQMLIDNASNYVELMGVWKEHKIVE